MLYKSKNKSLPYKNYKTNIKMQNLNYTNKKPKEKFKGNNKNILFNKFYKLFISYFNYKSCNINSFSKDYNYYNCFSYLYFNLKSLSLYKLYFKNCYLFY